MEQVAFEEMKKIINIYSPISSDTWLAFKQFCKIKYVKKHQFLYSTGDLLSSFAFVYLGLFRAYTTDIKGKDYNKVFFKEGTFPGSMVALLTAQPSQFSIEALEDSCIIEINFKFYRRLLLEKDDLKLFHIHYLEKNWLLAKDEREIQMALDDATQRYAKFLVDHADIAARVSQYHIASHLGITPTQLSRIRKSR